MTKKEFNAVDIQGKEDSVVVIEHKLNVILTSSKNKNEFDYMKLIKTHKLPIAMDKLLEDKPKEISIGVSILDLKKSGLLIIDSMLESFLNSGMKINIIEIDDKLTEVLPELNDFISNKKEEVKEMKKEEIKEVELEEMELEEMDLEEMDLEEVEEVEVKKVEKENDKMDIENIRRKLKNLKGDTEVKEEAESEAKPESEAKKESKNFERTYNGSFDESAFDNIESIISKQQEEQENYFNWFSSHGFEGDAKDWLEVREIPGYDIKFRFAQDKNVKTGKVNPNGFVMEINLFGLASKLLRFEAIEGINKKGEEVKFLSAKNFLLSRKNNTFTVSYGKWIKKGGEYKFNKFYNHGLGDNIMKVSMAIANAFFEKHFKQ